MITEIIIFFIIFAILGVIHEVLWSILIIYIKTKNLLLKGTSSLWMFPIYGSVFFIVLLVQNYLPEAHWFFRGMAYLFLILALEYISGHILKLILKKVPWDYSDIENPIKIKKTKKIHLHGLICLEHAPIWFIEGLFAEWIYLTLKTHLIF